MKIFAIIFVVAMATTEAIFMPPFGHFGGFPFGMMRGFPGMFHPGMRLGFPGYMGYRGAFPYRRGVNPAYLPPVRAAMSENPTSRTEMPALPAQDTVPAAMSNNVRKYPTY